MKHLVVCLLAALSLAFATPGLAEDAAEAAGNIEDGQTLYKQECRGCHGPTAKGLSSYPSLRGQTSAYLADRLTRYRKGEKFGPNTPLMAPRAKKLSDDDILNLAAFIASLDN